MVEDARVEVILAVLCRAVPSKSEAWWRPWVARVLDAIDEAAAPAPSATSLTDAFRAPIAPRWPMLPDGYVVLEKPAANTNTLYHPVTGRKVEMTYFLPNNEIAIDKWLIPALRSMGAAPQVDTREVRMR